MDDLLMFPKTVYEFMERHKIVDTEEVYTNRAELVPIFRMKQWFEHVNAETVRYGHWINKGDYAICSECGADSGTQYNGLEPIPKWSKFCPDCGARMD